MFFGEKLKARTLIEFGIIVYVKIKQNIQGKWKEKDKTCMFVGYGDRHNDDAYRFYNPSTKKIILS